jgi:hypothetical protein
MPATRARSVHDDLVRLQAAVRDAGRLVDERKLAMQRSVRELAALRTRLRDLHTDAALQNKPLDEAERGRLLDEIREREARCETRSVPSPVKPDTMVAVVVDVVAEAELHAAEMAAAEARRAIDDFRREHARELQADLAQRSAQVAEDLIDAVGQLDAVLARWRDARQEWLDFGAAPAEMQATPLPGIALQDIRLVINQAQGGARDPRGLYPMPARLAPGGDPDVVEYAGSLKGWAHVPLVISSEGGLLGH